MSTGTNPSATPTRPSIQSVMENGQLVWRLLQDDRVPTFLKVAIPLGVAVYFISPLDLIPDFIPILGQLDDLGVILLGMTLFINLAPRNVVNEHRERLGLAPMVGGRSGAGTPAAPDQETRVIDGTYQPLDRS
jgi:uncharacterized membrane protein YkvA (DUF1232 family)